MKNADRKRTCFRIVDEEGRSIQKERAGVVSAILIFA